MKKKFAEIKHLFGGEENESLGFTDDTELEVEWVEPRTLLTPYRLDVAIRYKYIEAYDKGWDTKFFADMYADSIRAFTYGTYTEGDTPSKNSLQKFFSTFHKLIETVKTSKLDENISLVPVGRDNIILNGAHRTACSLYFNKKVPIVRYPNNFPKPWICNALSLKMLNLETEYIDYTIAASIKLLNRPNFHVAIF